MKIHEVGDIVKYVRGGEFEVIYVDQSFSDDRPYQCCFAGGDRSANWWFRFDDFGPEEDATKKETDDFNYWHNEN